LIAMPRQVLLLAILGLLLGFASISTDLFLPALPSMAASLRAAPGTLALTISGYLAGFSAGQLLWGPIGDRFGRRAPIAAGLVLFVIGSAGCALAESAAAIIAWRVVQAVGACAGVVLARAMVRDLYEGDQAAKTLSTLMIVMAVAPLLGPSLGAEILLLAGWRAIFWSLVAVGLATLLAMLVVPETLPPVRRRRESLARAFAGYGGLLRERALLGYAGVCGFYFAGIFAYIAGSPFAYISVYHASPRLYGLLFAAGIIGLMAANFLNGRLVIRHGGLLFLRIGSAAAMLAGLGAALTVSFGFGGLAGLALPLLLFTAANGFINANAISGALAGFPQRAGAVSALVGAIQYGSGILGSALVAAFADGTPRPMAWVIACSGVGSAVCAWLLVPQTARAPVASKERFHQAR
jgi:DHA1 family bicyclomycin/chloramphenicol resistance-like MFS transporter